MPFANFVKTLALGSVVALAAGPAFAASETDPAVMTSLTTIKNDADQIAAGRFKDKQQLQAPAHEIGAEWYKVEPILAKSGGVLVETRMANASITAFARDWQQTNKARSAAKDVSSSVADLIAATKSAAPAH